MGRFYESDIKTKHGREEGGIKEGKQIGDRRTDEREGKQKEERNKLRSQGMKGGR